MLGQEYDAESGSRSGKAGAGTTSTGRTITLQMLLAADILQPGEGSMTIEYLVSMCMFYKNRIHAMSFSSLYYTKFRTKFY